MGKKFIPGPAGPAGISAGRAHTKREDHLVEQLAQIGEETVQEYRSGIETYNHGAHWETYQALARKLILPTYTEDHLNQIISSYANRKEPEEMAIVRGLYTGVLASKLTRKNQQKGKRTRICLNGRGNYFPYLLYFAHTLDEVIVEDFTGDYILRFAGSYGGSVKNIALAHITGDWAGAGIARYSGRAKNVTLADVKGRAAGAAIAWDGGRVEDVTLAGITGNWAGVGTAWKGRVGTFTLAYITGDSAGAHIAGNKGHADIVTLAHITGDPVGARIAGTGGRVKWLFASEIEGENKFLGYKGKVTSLSKHPRARRIEELLVQLQTKQLPEQLTRTTQELAEAIRSVKR